MDKQDDTVIKSLLKIAFTNERMLIELMTLPLQAFREYSSLFHFILQYYQRFSSLLTKTMLKKLSSKNDTMLQLYRQYIEIEQVQVQEKDFQALYQLLKMDYGRVALTANITDAVGELEKEQNPVVIAEKLIHRLQLSMETTRTPALKHKLKEEALSVVDKYKSERKEALVTVPFGFPTLDREVGGAKKGDLVVILGATGGGKSTFLINLACNAFRAGYKVLFVSLEIPLRRMRARLHSNLLGLDYSSLIHYTMEPEQYQKQVEQLLQYKGEITVIDLPMQATVSQLAGYVVQEQPELVLIDYIGLMQSTRKYEADWQEQTNIANGLKMLARQQEVVVITAAQLNRRGNMREDLYLGDIARGFGVTNPASFVFGIRASGSLMTLKLLKANDCPLVTISLNVDFSHQLLTENSSFQSQSLDVWGGNG